MNSPSFTDHGSGRPVLLLHGGGGPVSVAAFAATLAEHARVITPTHPGFQDTPRPDALTDVPGLARLYAQLLEELDLRDVVVVGNSVGGWIAAELALLQTQRVGALVLVDAVGIEVPGHPVADFFSLSMPEVMGLSYFAPERFPVPPPAPANRAALELYAGRDFADPGLRERLAGVTTPTTVIWGEADWIVDPEYGRALAEAIPGASFQLLERTGHLPQLETPDALLQALLAVISQTAPV